MKSKDIADKALHNWKQVQNKEQYESKEVFYEAFVQGYFSALAPIALELSKLVNGFGTLYTEHPDYDSSPFAIAMKNLTGQLNDIVQDLLTLEDEDDGK